MGYNTSSPLLLLLQPLLLLLQPLLLPLQPLLLPPQPLLLQLQPCCCSYSPCCCCYSPCCCRYSPCCYLLQLTLLAAAAPCCCCYYCCCSLLPLLLVTAAAGGGAAGSAGSAAGAGGAGGATGSDGGVAGAGGAGPTTDRHYLSWPLSRQLQPLGVDSGGHSLSRTTPPLSSFASGFFSEPVQVVGALVFYVLRRGGSRGPAPSCVSQVDLPPLVEPLEVSSDSSGPVEGGDPAADDTAATRRSPRLETPPGFPPRPSLSPLQPATVDSGAETAGAESRGAEPEGEGSGGASCRGTTTGGASSWGAATGGADSGGPASPSGGGAVGDPAGGPGAGQPPQPDLLETLLPQAIHAWIVRRGSPGGGGYGPVGAGAASPGGTAGTGGAASAGGTRGAVGAGGAGATSPRGVTGAAGAGPTSLGGIASAGGAGGTAGARGAGGGGTGGAGAASPGGAGAASPGGARRGGAGAAGAGGTTGAGGAGGATGAVGTGDAGGTTGARGPRTTGASGAGGAGGAVGAAGAGGASAVGAGGAGAAGTALCRPFFYPQLQSSLLPPDSVLCQVLSLLSSTGLPLPLLCPPTDQSQPQLLPESLTERREPETRASTPVRARRVARPRPLAVPGTHGMALRPSFVPHRVVLPEPPASSFPHISDPESDLACAASPTVTRLLTAVVTDPDLESTAAFALVTELVDFAARSCLDYVASLVTESESVCPPSVGGELALGSDVLEDNHFKLECLAATLPRFASMLLCHEGDPDVLDIPTPRSYAEAIAGEYSS
ncbi:unnamed protein product [Closterium sp. NIES-54]